MSKCAPRLVASLIALAVVAFATPAVAAPDRRAPVSCRELVAALTSAGIQASALDVIAQACVGDQRAETTSPASTNSLDPIICPILRSLVGTYGFILIDAEGDVWFCFPFFGCIKIYDCPPYDPLFAHAG